MKRFKLPRVRMKLALSVSVVLLIIGLIVAVAGVFIYLTAEKVITDFEPVADSYLNSAISMLQSTRNAIAAVEPTLASASQITEEATRTSINLVIEDIRATLSGIQTNLEDTKAMLPTYLDQARFAAFVAIVGLSSFFGLIISLGGTAILSLRKEINKISDKLE